MAKLKPSCRVAADTSSLNASVMSNFSTPSQKEWMNAHLKRKDDKVSSFAVGLDVAINAMLSGFGTPLVNMISVLIQQTLKNSNATIGAALDSIGLTNGGREWNQVKAMWDASLDGFGADLLYFREGFQKGYSLDQEAVRRTLKMSGAEFDDYLKTTLKVDHPDLLTDRQRQDLLNDMQDYMHNSIGRTRVGGTFIEGAVRFPTKAIVGIDEYGKARYRRQSLFQTAAKYAKEDSKLGLGKYDDLYKEYKKQLYRDGSQSIQWDQRLKSFVAARDKTRKLNGFKGMASELDVKREGNEMVAWVRDDALFNAFQQKLEGVPRAAQEMRHKYPAFALFAPFIKTPWNIIKEGYNYVPIIPMIQAGKVTKDGVTKARMSLRTSIIPMHGPSRKMTTAELMPRQVIGASIFAMVGSMYHEDSLTGTLPSSAAERQRWKDTGKKPYSIKIGDTWIEYNRFEPIATPLAIAADLFDFTSKYQDDDDINTDEGKELVSDLLSIVKSNLTSKTFLEGYGSLIDAVADPNVDTASLIGETVLRPFTPALMANMTKAADTYERQTIDGWDRLQARIPILRSQLPVQYGVYGEAKKTDPIKSLFNIGFSTEENLTPLQRHVNDLGWNKGGITPKFQGVQLSNQQLGDLRQLNAEMLTPILESVIQMPEYAALSDERKKKHLDSRVRKTRARVGQKFANQLKQQDPEMARKFLSAWYKQKGLFDQRPDSIRD